MALVIQNYTLSSRNYKEYIINISQHTYIWIFQHSTLKLPAILARYFKSNPVFITHTNFTYS
jgi:hypothetical protein